MLSTIEISLRAVWPVVVGVWLLVGIDVVRFRVNVCS
jgi:hypothetical protein